MPKNKTFISCDNKTLFENNIRKEYIINNLPVRAIAKKYRIGLRRFYIIIKKNNKTAKKSVKKKTAKKTGGGNVSNLLYNDIFKQSNDFLEQSQININYEKNKITDI